MFLINIFHGRYRKYKLKLNLTSSIFGGNCLTTRRKRDVSADGSIQWSMITSEVDETWSYLDRTIIQMASR